MKKPRMRSGRKYHRGRYWIQQRDAAFTRAGESCEVTGEPLFFALGSGLAVKEVWKRACHHILAERWVRSFVKGARSEEHTSELQSPDHLVCRLLLEKKKNTCQSFNTIWC